MAQKNQDFEMWANDDLAIRVENIYNEATNALIAVGDILGARWSITPYNEEEPKLIEKDLTLGQILVPIDGAVVITLLASDTANLGGGKYSHQLKLEHGGGVQTACVGTMTINIQVTNNPL